MNRIVAERIELLRCGPVMHSWRRIAEIICEEFPKQPVEDGWKKASDAHGNQLYGIELCRDAMCFLMGCKDIRQVPSAERDRWDS